MGKYKMAHTMYRVMDLNRSIDFYEKALGFVEVRRRDVPEYKFTLVFLGDGDSQCHQLELTYNYDPEKPYDLGTGYGHLAVLVDNLEESYAEHLAGGFEPTTPKGLGSDGQTRYYFITDPDGYKIEIVRK
ncbi:MAG: VOC family protein [Eubacteriaceae bacterium]